ncbi:MAG TPA: folate-binding protein YgfZ [Burkholderiales bacterium]|nr:folate-binding protein YgfZ [Burkholderiales bacterium]
MSGPSFSPFISSLSQFGLIRFAGDDAQAFLHAQLSCDVAALTPGQSTYGAYCTPKGRALASFLLWRSADGFFMQLPTSLREPIQKQLTKFILRSKVKVADVTADFALIGVAGSNASTVVPKAAGLVPKTVRGVEHSNEMTVIRLEEERYEVVVPRDKAAGVLEALAAAAEKVDPASWDLLDIRAGIPVITPATQEAFVPQMVNLDVLGGVSFEKGCYPGQEIVARMHYRGTLKQRMYLAHVEGTEQPQPGDKLYSPAFGEQSSGTIVNAAAAPDGGSDVLAVVQIAAGGTNSEVHWKNPAGPRLTFRTLPYSVS